MWISEFADKKSANNEGRLYAQLEKSLNLYAVRSALFSSKIG